MPELTAGERSGLFAMEDALYGCYLRVGDPGPWAGPWAGIARLEMPSGIGRDAAVEAADQAAGWLPGFASALHRDARAPVNLTPIAGLERHLHRLQGDARLALRAVRKGRRTNKSPILAACRYPRRVVVELGQRLPFWPDCGIRLELFLRGS